MTTVHELMSTDVCTVSHDTSLTEAARVMRDEDIGDVIVLRDGGVCGILTDRDVVVRSTAEGSDPTSTTVGSLCTHEVVRVAPGDDVGVAISRMREHSIRRLPVCDQEDLVGVVSLGDLAASEDPTSVLGDISTAPGQG